MNKLEVKITKILNNIISFDLIVNGIKDPKSFSIEVIRDNTNNIIHSKLFMKGGCDMGYIPTESEIKYIINTIINSI